MAKSQRQGVRRIDSRFWDLRAVKELTEQRIRYFLEIERSISQWQQSLKQLIGPEIARMLFATQSSIQVFTKTLEKIDKLLLEYIYLPFSEVDRQVR